MVPLENSGIDPQHGINYCSKIFPLESWQNGYCTGLENRRP